MFRKLVLVAIGSAMLTAAGCRDEGPVTPLIDMSMPGGNDDMPAGAGDGAMKSYIAATLHDIDVGTVATKKAVTVTDVIAVSPVTYFKAKAQTLCKYEVFVQDPACTSGPCGLVVEVDGPAVMANTCPKESMSGTVLANVKPGDKLTISGTTDAFSKAGMATDMTPTGTVVQHSITADIVNVTASGQTLPAAIAIQTANYGDFVSYSGAGWARYEGMLVKLTNVTIATTTGTGDFTTSPGNPNWGRTFDFLYRYKLGGDAGVFPTATTSYKSITGVVSTLFGGTILPTGPNDFVP